MDVDVILPTMYTHLGQIKQTPNRRRIAHEIIVPGKLKVFHNNPPTLNKI
jgi:hypothetical protein